MLPFDLWAGHATLSCYKIGLGEVFTEFVDQDDIGKLMPVKELKSIDRVCMNSCTEYLYNS